MKRIFISLLLILFTTKASAGFIDKLIDWEKVGTFILENSDGLNKRLERIRMNHHQNFDNRKEWEVVCDMVNIWNKNLEMVDVLLNKYNYATSACLPLSKTIQLQNKILNRCMNYYDKEVQLNFDENFADTFMMIEESQEIIKECLP